MRAVAALRLVAQPAAADDGLARVACLVLAHLLAVTARVSRPRVPLTAGEREDWVIAMQEAAIHAERLGPLDRWSRAWVTVADAYLREGNTADAARCLDDGLTLWRWTPGARGLS